MINLPQIDLVLKHSTFSKRTMQQLEGTWYHWMGLRFSGWIKRSTWDWLGSCQLANIARSRTAIGTALAHFCSVFLLWLGLSPFPVIVTTRIITFLVGNPYKPSFPLLLGRGTTQIMTDYSKKDFQKSLIEAKWGVHWFSEVIHDLLCTFVSSRHSFLSELQTLAMKRP